MAAISHASIPAAGRASVSKRRSQHEDQAMVFEFAEIAIKAGMEKEFEANVAKSVPLFLRAKACHGIELHRSIEQPSRYTLIVQWETVEDHTVAFRSSDDFKEWRKLVGHCFETAPAVHHANRVAKAS